MTGASAMISGLTSVGSTTHQTQVCNRDWRRVIATPDCSPASADRLGSMAWTWHAELPTAGYSTVDPNTAFLLLTIAITITAMLHPKFSSDLALA